MESIEKKIYDGLRAFKFEEAKSILGACTLRKVSLVNYRIEAYYPYTIKTEAIEMYTPQFLEYGYIWNSLVGNCWVRANIDENTIMYGFVSYSREKTITGKELETYDITKRNGKILEILTQDMNSHYREI